MLIFQGSCDSEYALIIVCSPNVPPDQDVGLQETVGFWKVEPTH